MLDEASLFENEPHAPLEWQGGVGARLVATAVVARAAATDAASVVDIATGALPLPAARGRSAA